jgi:hypothetical protein
VSLSSAMAGGGGGFFQRSRACSRRKSLSTEHALTLPRGARTRVYRKSVKSFGGTAIISNSAGQILNARARSFVWKAGRRGGSTGSLGLVVLRSRTSSGSPKASRRRRNACSLIALVGLPDDRPACPSSHYGWDARADLDSASGCWIAWISIKSGIQIGGTKTNIKTGKACPLPRLRDVSESRRARSWTDRYDPRDGA